MSKFAATLIASCQRQVGWLGAALSALALLAPADAIAAVPDPVLRRSEHVDMRRLGKLSDDERSVLRIEWRAAVSGAEEARTVQDMLDSLRRMDATLGEISRLVRSIPVRPPVLAVTAAEPPAADGYDLRLMAANISAIFLIAIWWFRRRNSAAAQTTSTAPATAAQADQAAANSPAIATVAEPAPPALAKAADLSSEPRASAPAAAQPDKPRQPDTARTQTAGTGAVPAALMASNLKSAAPPEPAVAHPSAAPSTAEGQAIDFLLEDADPEVAARENARLQKLQAMNRRKAPERQNESNVEPTLELAGIMMSLGLAEGAAQTLLEYTEANPRQALQHWLKLLDIYRSSGNQEDFSEAAEKLRQNFNIQAEDWAKASAARVPMLEEFSRVAEQVQKLWSQPAECIVFLKHLLEDNREGSRAGFPQPVAEEILLLIEILKGGQTAAA